LKLFLLRHGDTLWTITKRYQGTTDVPLNAKGVRQARALARALRGEKPSRLYVSTLGRARETARPISRQLKLKPVSDARLNELHFGKWEGADYKQLARKGGKFFRQWREGKLKRPPGGESVDQLARRIGEFFSEIASRHRDETVFVVSHGGPIKMFFFKALNGKRRASLPSIWSYRIDPGSISVIEGTPELFQIAFTNRTDHLP